MFTRMKQRFEQFVVSRLVGPRIVAADPRKIDVNYSPTEEGSKVNHALWTSVLQRCVQTGISRDGLNYCSLFNYNLVLNDKDIQSNMDEYMSQLSAIKLDELNDNERCSVLMNLYNAVAIKTLLDAMKEGKTLKSITDLSTVRQAIWKRPAFNLNGKEVCLDDIEHNFLRREWNEPRVHACVVCASMSCPNLRNEAYVPDRLDTQMTEQMNSWLINDTKGIKIEGENIQISRIFLWFKDDFVSSQGNEIEFIRKYRQDIPTTPTISYFEYNWMINITDA
mmetsp:Transcript_12253/g.14793  ORF Transcript_12253/g.14793 Transcript_12253/m.14793 type:complete len:279 (-) Transcript_12253:47-883(-)